MKINRVSISGFLSFGKKQVIDLSSDGVISLEGHNGVGKTSVLESITWALYGNKAARNSPINDSHKSSAVTVELETDSGEYVVTRRMRRTKTGSTSTLEVLDSTGRNLFPNATKRELDEHVVDIVGLNESSFYSILMMKQNGGSAFINATAKDRRHILADMYPELTKWTEYNKAIDGMRRDVARDVKACQSITDNLAASVAKNQARIDDIIREWPVHPREVLETGGNYDEQVLAARELEIRNKTEASLTEDKTGLRSALQRKKSLAQLNTRAESLKVLMDDMKALTGVLDSISRQVRAEDSAILSSLSMPEGDKCPSCHQEIGPDARHDIENHFAVLKGYTDARDSFAAMANSEYVPPPHAVEKISSSYRAVSTALTNATSEATELGRRIVSAQEKLSSVREREALESIVNAGAPGEGLSTEKASIAAGRIADCESVIRENSAELSSQLEKLEALTERLSVLQRAKSLTDESGIPKLIADELVTRLGEYHQSIIDEHFGGPDISVEYAATEETGDNSLDVMVSISGSDRRPIEVVSGGERAVVALSGFFAFSKLMNDIRPGSASTLFFDEPFINLDPENLTRAIEGVYSYTHGGNGVETVVLISHSDHASPLADDVIRLVTGDNDNTEIAHA